MSAYNISTEGCLEREDLLLRLDNHPGGASHLGGEVRRDMRFLSLFV